MTLVFVLCRNLSKVWAPPCILHANSDTVSRWTYDHLLQVLQCPVWKSLAWLNPYTHCWIFYLRAALYMTHITSLALSIVGKSDKSYCAVDSYSVLYTDKIQMLIISAYNWRHVFLFESLRSYQLGKIYSECLLALLNKQVICSHFKWNWSVCVLIVR